MVLSDQLWVLCTATVTEQLLGGKSNLGSVRGVVALGKCYTYDIQ